MLEQAVKPALPVAHTRNASSSEQIIDDAGEKIGGARKDLWATRGMTLEDLNSMSDAEAAKWVIKKNVWQPDYAQMIAAGAAPEAVALVKVVYDKLAARPRHNTPEGRKDYITMMHAIRDVLSNATTIEAVETAHELVKARIGLQSGRSSRDNSIEQKVASRIYYSVTHGRHVSLRISHQMKLSAENLVAAGFPIVEPWRTRFFIEPIERLTGHKDYAEAIQEAAAKLNTPLTLEQLFSGVFRVRQKGGRSRTIIAYAPTMESAVEAAREAYERAIQSQRNKDDTERPPVKVIVRSGLPICRSGDIKSMDFIDTFGFRGVEFGKWATNDERQTLSNYAYEALLDLADVLGIPPQTLTFGGALGLAIGARGSGRFGAHYEWSKRVFNFTKLRGAGAVAHEWGHAFDHYFGELDRADAYTTEPRGASGWRSVYTLHTNDNLRLQMKLAWQDVMKSLYMRPRTEADGPGRRPEVATAYYQNAVLLNGKSTSCKGYWCRPTELWTRAFESFVFDKLQQRGARSDFLVHGVEPDRYAGPEYRGNRYPAEDRATINAAIQRLISTLLIRTGENGMPTLH